MITGRRRGLFALFMFFCCAVFVTLCVWQVKRLAWKQEILAAINAELAKPEVSALSAADFDAVSSKQAHIKRGVLQGSAKLCQAVYLDNRAYQGKTGHNLLLPLRLETTGLPDIDVVYLNMGWVEKSQPIPSCEDASEVAEITVSGLLTLPRTNRFTYVGEIAPRHWMAAMPQATAAHDKITGAVSPLILVVDAVPEAFGEAPLLADIKILDGATFMPPNNHRQYALFWGAMAMITAILTVYVLRQKE